MRRLYFILAVIGAIIPYLFFIQHFNSEGIGPGAFVSAIFANPAAGGFTSDLLISSAIFWIMMFREHRGGRGPNPFLFILLNCLIGLSCALPAYLSAREGQSG